MSKMIVTHTRNVEGQRRVYLGGKSSVECYVEPKADGIGWTFRLINAVAGVQLTLVEQRLWAVHTLQQLAEALHVDAEQLASVPFECISALHDSDPFSGRRIASSKRKAAEHGFVASEPNISRPRADSTAQDGRSWSRSNRAA